MTLGIKNDIFIKWQTILTFHYRPFDKFLFSSKTIHPSRTEVPISGFMKTKCFLRWESSERGRGPGGRGRTLGGAWPTVAPPLFSCGTWSRSCVCVAPLSRLWRGRFIQRVPKAFRTVVRVRVPCTPHPWVWKPTLCKVSVGSPRVGRRMAPPRIPGPVPSTCESAPYTAGVVEWRTLRGRPAQTIQLGLAPF